MRLLSFVKNGHAGVGVRCQDGIAATGYDDMITLIREGAIGLERVRRAVDRGELIEPDQVLAPVAPSKILCSGVNYHSHKEENPDAVMPLAPFFFTKLSSAVIGPGQAIRIPLPTTLLDYEAELAVVIGHCRDPIERTTSRESIFGYTVLNDVSARDLQFNANQLTLAKGSDTFAPLGPELVTADEIPDPLVLNVRTYLNGREMQNSSTADMIFAPHELLEFVSSYVTLSPGDIVATGTPAGVGYFREPPVYLRPGDTITVEVDKIGRLTNSVVAGWQP